MNRQIKFRAWDKDHKRMITHFMVDAVTGNLFFDTEDGDFQEWTQDECGSLMQFTGLLDKNGREIYEGDVIQRWDGKKQVMEYSKFYHSDGWESLKGIGFSTEMDLEDIEVIGNIHENPELLKAGEL